MSQRSLRRAAARRALAAARRQARLSTRTGCLAAAAIGTGAIFAPSASAATFQVSSLADAGAGSLRQALIDANAAPGPDTITFANGLTGEIFLASELPVTDATTIDGPGADVLTISGDGVTRILSTGSTTISISGLTFADGATPGRGAALDANGSTIEISDAVFTNNASGSDGGAISVEQGSLTLSGSRLSGNTAAHYGGALHTAYVGSGLTISDSTFTGNTAADFGGGIAIYDQSGPTVIERTTLSGNTATVQDGGGIWVEDIYDGNPFTMRDSTITGNTAGRGGGGISFGENFSGDTAVVGSTVTGNTATTGGGVAFADLQDDGAFSLRSSTVTDNTATGTGGGVYRGFTSPYGSSENRLAIISSVVADNAAASGPDVGTGDVTGDLTIGNSLVRDLDGVPHTESPAGTVLTGVDPQLGPLADNGGPTQTRLPQAGGPLVDAGLAGGLTTDQRGFARTFDFESTAQTLGSDGTDIGAVELAVNLPPTLTTPGAQTVDEGATLTFGTATGNAIGVGEPEGTPVEMALTAGQGALTLPQTTGLTFAQGDGSADAAMRFSGALGDVRAALDGLSYAAAAAAGGSSATLGISLTDSAVPGASGTNTVTGSVPITIRDTTAPSAPPVAPPLCNGVAITLSPVLSGKRVTITGVTLPRYAGQRVSIRSGGSTLTTATVTGEGTFTTTLRAPSKARRAKVKYRAVIDTVRSPAYRLERQTVVLSQSGRTITGRVKRAGQRNARKGVLYLDASCTARRRVASVRISRSGRFKATLAEATTDFAVYRLRVRLDRRTVSWSAPVLVVPK